jgi:hypothetical protein
MKKTTISLFAAFTMVSAQTKTADFSGRWELDAAKSKLGERMRVESITMAISQTAKDLKIERTTKRVLRSEGVETRAGANPESGGMGRPVSGTFNGGNMTETFLYSLEGKETKDEIPGIPGATSVLKAKWEKEGKLVLSSSRKAETPMGERMIVVNETWSLAPDGKTLTVVREQETPRGKVSSEMVFVKK